MCNGKDCNCGCKNRNGNYTYVRYASNEQGSNLSKYIDKNNSGNIDNIKRCYQSIFTSPVQLDENAPIFAANFTNWIYICGCDSCGCNWFDYYKEEAGNRFRFVADGLKVDQDNSFENVIENIDMYNGDVIILPLFKDNNGDLLQSGVNYCFEFKFDYSLFTNPNSSIEISFGNGISSTVVSIDQTNTSGVFKGVVMPVNGSILSHNMVIRLVNDASPSGTQTINFKLFDFRLADESCCADENTPSTDLQIPSLQAKVVTIGVPNANFQDYVSNLPSPEYLFKSKFYLKWDSENDNFLQHNPEIWLFRWSSSSKRLLKNNLDLGDYRLKVTRGGNWRHPSHSNGIKFSGSSKWGGSQNFKLFDSQDLVNLDRETEFSLPNRDTWVEIPIDPRVWFKTKDSLNKFWDSTESFFDNAGAPKLVSSFGTTKTRQVRFKFAIVIDSPTLGNGSPTNPAPKKIIGIMSDELILRIPTPEPNETWGVNEAIGFFRYRIGSASHIKFRY